MPEKNMPSLSSYASPQELADDNSVSNDQKREMLIRWKNDLNSRLVAESEGMSNEDPLAQSEEGLLAEELKNVNQLLKLFGGE